MKRMFLFLVILTVITSISLQISSAADGNPNIRHTIIAATGDAAPAGGNYLASSFANVSLNARHEVAFDASVGVTTGIFVGDGKTTSTTSLGENGGFVSNPFITPNGDVVFDVNNSDTYKSNGKSIIPLVRAGDPAPGGGTLTPAGEPRATSDNGTIAYSAFVTDSTATQGIFRSDGAQTSAIARDDMNPPTGGNFLVMGDTVINDRGQVAFYSVMTGGTAEFGIFRGEGRELTPVFVANQIAPGGTTFADFGNPIINSHGLIATTASLNNNDAGIFVGDGTDTVAIAVQGQPAPKGGNYNGQFLVPTRLNDQGEVAFDARLTGGTSSSEIFRGDGRRTIPVALSGTNAPGTAGTFASFRDFQFLNDGRVAFIATLTLGVGGVNTSNNTGLWIGSSDEDLQLIVRTGDIIDGKVLTRLPQVGPGNQLDMNQNSVLWVGTFGLAKAVVLSRVIGDNNQQ
jgi:hypothetical protein